MVYRSKGGVGEGVCGVGQVNIDICIPHGQGIYTL